MKKTLQPPIQFPLLQIGAILLLFLVMAGLLLVGYSYPSDDSLPPWAIKVFGFGFQQFRGIPLALPLGVILLFMIGVGLYRRFRYQINRIFNQVQGGLKNRWLVWIVISLIASVVFFLLRNQFLNPDGLDFALKFARDIPAKGAHVTHDEMWELYLHSRFWLYTNHYFGWTVALSYQVVSSLAGGAFVFLLWLLSRALLPQKWLAFFLLVLSGAYMQLYFGDVENYTLTGVLLLAYLLASIWFLQGRASVALAAGILAAALTFHLLAGFILPSLAVLYWIALRRRRFWDMAAGVILFCAIVGATLLFFHTHGLPIQDLYYRSFAFGYGGEVKTWLRPNWDIFSGQINLLFLLFPAWGMSVAAVIFALRRMDEGNAFFLAAVGGMMFLFFAWKSAIGIYNDWNLFANSAFVLAVFTWYTLLRQPWRWQTEILAACFVINALPSYCWIIASHFR